MITSRLSIITFLSTGLLTSSLAYATVPPIAACEFSMGDDIGVCYQNQTSQQIDKVAVEVSADEFTSKVFFFPVNVHWYADSTSSIHILEQMDIKKLTYKLFVDELEIKDCAYELTISNTAKMPIPKVIYILQDAHNNLFCKLS